MKTRKLGSEGFDVSEVALGCWQLGADWGTSIKKEAGLAILEAAANNGITFFDTADVYGNGRSETLIGEFLNNTDKKIQIATKFGRAGDAYPDKYSKDVLRKSVEGSLKRLDVDAIDLLQLHCVPESLLLEGYIFDWLRDLKQEGLIKNFGASVETVEQGLMCLKQEEILSLQVIYNVFRQKLTKELLPQAEKKGVGIIVRLPLASGLLTGKFNKNTTFPENDHRNYNRNGDAFNVGETFAGLPFDKGLEFVDTISNTILPQGVSMVELALRWILDHQAVSCIIPGASSTKQVLSNVDVSNLQPLSIETHTSLSKLYSEDIHQCIRGVY